MKYFLQLICIGLLSAQSASVKAADSIALTTEDLELSDLATMGARQLEPGSKGVGVPFVFPHNISDKKHVYGIDISHYNFDRGRSIDWGSLHSKGVSFVFMKATDGQRYFDKTLQTSWKGLALAARDGKKVYRGAYHFLRSDDSPDAEADNFIATLLKRTDFEQNSDLPPVVDIEWDCKKDPTGRVIRDAKGNCLDKWKSKTPEQIKSHLLSYINKIETRFHVSPIIYTNAQWWSSVGLKRDPFLVSYRVWIADYSRSAQNDGEPHLPPGYNYAIWQFTENGKVVDSCEPTDKKSRCEDANVVASDIDTFISAMGVKK